MKPWPYFLLLLALAFPVEAVAPHNRTIALHKATAQAVTNAVATVITVDTADAPYDPALFSVSSGVITLKASGRYRVTLQGGATTSVTYYQLFISVNGDGGTRKALEYGASADERETGVSFTAYYEAGTTLALMIQCNGTTPSTTGAIAVQLL